jgi:hypothetical protein
MSDRDTGPALQADPCTLGGQLPVAKPTLEAARSLVSAIVIQVEDRFQQQTGRRCILRNSADILDLASVLNLQSKAAILDLCSGFPVAQFYIGSRLERYDIAHGFLLQYLNRHSHVFAGLHDKDRACVFEGLLGGLFYNMPARHYYDRAQLLEQQVLLGNGAYVDMNISALLEELRKLHDSIHDPTRSSSERRFVSERFSDAFANVLVAKPLFYIVHNKGGGLHSFARTMSGMIEFLRQPRERHSQFR